MDVVEIAQHYCECGDLMEVAYNRHEGNLYIKCWNKHCKNYQRIGVYRPSVRTVFIYNDPRCGETDISKLAYPPPADSTGEA